MKFAVCSEMFQGKSVAEVIEIAARLGYDGVELAPFTFCESVTEVSAEERAKMRKRAADAGVELMGLHWLLVKPEGLHINSPDADLRRKTAEYLGELARFCRDIGGYHMVFGSPKQRYVAPGVSYEQAWAWAVETIRRAGEECHEAGVILGMEPLARDTADFLNRAEEVRRFVREVDVPSVKVALDCVAMYDEEKPIPQIIRETKDLISHLHVNDSNKREPGSGKIDFVAIGNVLREIGYDKYASFEPFEYDEDPEAQAARALAHVKKCFGAQ